MDWTDIFEEQKFCQTNMTKNHFNYYHSALGFFRLIARALSNAVPDFLVVAGAGSAIAMLDIAGTAVGMSDAEMDASQPSSPRLRQTTFGATLDFIEALCDASSGLTAFAPVSTFDLSESQGRRHFQRLPISVYAVMAAGFVLFIELE